MSNKYQSEINDFIKKFQGLQDKRIVLYGIGRYTATLVENLHGFHIVGLMDKDLANVGKDMFGLPILDVEEVEKRADLVIINTAESYWKVIYQRIQSLSIPVYYRNGERAQLEMENIIEIPYWESSLEDLRNQIGEADIISFDFFDTLFSRCVCNPKDVFEMMDNDLEKDIILSEKFTEIRAKALQNVRTNYMLSELYEEIQKETNLSNEVCERIQKLEIEIEKRLLMPRKTMIACLKEALEVGKEIYIVSDMYLPKGFYREKLKEHGITLPDSRILVSCELGKSKLHGDLWKDYQENVVRGRIALHVGDNGEADIEKPQKYGIRSFYVASNTFLLEHSSLWNMSSQICSLYDSSVMGLVLNRLFENPFALNQTKGQIWIESDKDMGYCVFGPVILTFFEWMLRETEKDGIDRIVFMARDGYFLKEDFEYYASLTGYSINTEYVGISRQLAMTAAAETEEDILELIYMPYSGTVSEMLEDRFHIKVDNQEEPDPSDYIPQIRKYVAKVRENYRTYIENFHLDKNCAVVDLGYYGNNQHYLNKISGLNMTGYYFNANLSKENLNAKTQVMKPCFQSADDLMGEKSGVLRKQIYLESFLTAPYGMIQEVGQNGDFICKEGKLNQQHFQEKEETNQGVKNLISDYVLRCKVNSMQSSVGLIDAYYGKCFSDGMDYSDVVKKSYYNDNGFMNRIESALFY